MTLCASPARHTAVSRQKGWSPESLPGERVGQHGAGGPVRVADWAAQTIQRDGFEPWRLPVAVSGGHVVGTAYLQEYAGVGGWVQQVAVARERRGRGLGKALLSHAFVEPESAGRLAGSELDRATSDFAQCV